MKDIMHTPPHEIVSTSSDAPQTKFSLAKTKFGMHLMEDTPLINSKKLPRKCGKAFTKSYALKKNYYTF